MQWTARLRGHAIPRPGHDVDDRHVRSGPQPHLLGNWKPNAVLNGASRPGDDEYTCSIVAINPITASWRGDLWFRRTTRTTGMQWKRRLVDGDFHGHPRKMLMQSSRNGFFSCSTAPMEKASHGSLRPRQLEYGHRCAGRPIPDPKKEPAPDGRLIAPDEGGLTNFALQLRSKERAVHRRCSSQLQHLLCKPADGAYGWAGADYGFGVKACLRQSTTRRAKSAGVIFSDRAVQTPAC